MHKLRPIYTSGAITRFHTKRMVHKQTVAEHSWGVATIILWMYGEDHLPSSALLAAALTHDAAELATGDIPAPVKWGNALLAAALGDAEDQFREEHRLTFKLTPQEEMELKIADSLELVLYCIAEANLGNRTALHSARSVISLLLRLPLPSSSISTLIASVDTQVSDLERKML